MLSCVLQFFFQHIYKTVKIGICNNDPEVILKKKKSKHIILLLVLCVFCYRIIILKFIAP